MGGCSFSSVPDLFHTFFCTRGDCKWTSLRGKGEQDGVAVQERGDDPLPALPPERGSICLRVRAGGTGARAV